MVEGEGAVEDVVRDGVATGTLICTAVLVVFYALNGIGYHFPATLPYISFITVTDDGREGWLELVEALFWIVAAVAFALAARRRGASLTSAWLVLFALMSVVAFGEEISWGQQLGLFEPSETVKRINAQNELNLHNTDVAALLGIAPDHFLFPYLGGPSGVTKLLNPLFMLVCVTLWFLLPSVAIRMNARHPNGGRGASGAGAGWWPLRLWRAVPVPRRALRYFVLGNVLAYLVVDKLFYDVSELLELGLSMSGLLVSLDLLLGPVVRPARFASRSAGP